MTVAALFVETGDRERFFAKTRRDESTGCLIWMAGKDKDGYGKFQLNRNGRQAHVRAHRFAFFLKHGEWPSRLALHSCDTAACVEADHLEDGTQAKNVRDCMARGRHRPGVMLGSRHPRAMATEADVLAWRDARAKGESVASIARRVGRPAASVSHAIIGRTWRHI